jgi:hypothetical protein
MEVKIYIYPVPRDYQPDHQNFVWPPQNRRSGQDFGVEQNFLDWLTDSGLVTNSISEADWVYLPVFWNRLYINVPDESGNWGGSDRILPKIVDECLDKGYQTFTVSEADERVLHPRVDFGNMIMFCSSRRDNHPLNIDIPLLAAPHNLPRVMPPIKYLACFLGNLATDGVRMQMRDALAHRTDCKVEHANYGEDYYAMTMLESYIALAPRGQGAQSFRMYEAMALGTIPLYISDTDCRPFKQWVDWGNISYYCRDATEVNGLLDSIIGKAWHEDDLMEMGARAKDVYDTHLAYNKWCKWAIAELEQL